MPFVPDRKEEERAIVARLIQPEKETVRPKKLTPSKKKTPRVLKKAEGKKTEPPLKKPSRRAERKEPRKGSIGGGTTKGKVLKRQREAPVISEKKRAPSERGLSERNRQEKGVISRGEGIERKEIEKKTAIKQDEGSKETPASSLTKPLGPEALFDKKIISEVAKGTEVGGPKPKSGVTFSTKELKYHSYMMKLKERIESIWVYPEEAARRGIYGDLWINFTIKKDGSLGEVKLVRTSGYPELDEAAMKALKEAAPYWPLPEKWKIDALTVKGHFIYNLYGMYIR
ncbi:MAG: energy transducer TonB [Nitrospirae bacterium]|nr:MAG: energy transducer TonB [Nitrospirota bacterium]